MASTFKLSPQPEFVGTRHGVPATNAIVLGCRIDDDSATPEQLTSVASGIRAEVLSTFGDVSSRDFTVQLLPTPCSSGADSDSAAAGPACGAAVFVATDSNVFCEIRAWCAGSDGAADADVNHSWLAHCFVRRKTTATCRVSPRRSHPRVGTRSK